MMEVLSGTKQKSKVHVHDEFMYKRKKNYFYCTFALCKASMKELEGGALCLQRTHNHEPDLVALQEVWFRNSLRS